MVYRETRKFVHPWKRRTRRSFVPSPGGLDHDRRSIVREPSFLNWTPGT